MKPAPVIRFPIVVYGIVHDNLVFIKKPEALTLVSLNKALKESKTWGAFRANVPSDRYEAILNKIRGWNDGEEKRLGDFEVFYEGLRKIDSSVTKEAGYQAYRRLPVGQRLPTDNDVFDAADIPGFCDGDWPNWPAQEMLAWVPRLIQVKYGSQIRSTLNGPFLRLDPQREYDILKAFATYRYLCLKDQQLIYSVHR